MAWFDINADELDRLHQAVGEYPGNAEKAVNEVLHNEAGPVIQRRIDPLIHPSGRTFKGHRKSAKGADWGRYDAKENLTVTVGAKAKYRYLYFPDDGSNTRRHAGNQQFFRRGGEAATPEVVDMCVTAITNELKG